jgi:hypothetical protein
MLSNGNQYFSQGFQYPQQGLTPPQLGLLGVGAPQFGPQGVPGAGAYSGNAGWGPESAHQHGFAQQIPFGNSFAATSGQAAVGPQLIWALSQLAQQVAAQGVVAQQLGVVLSQLTQQFAPQALQSFGAQGFAGFAPQIPGWAIHRPAMA